VNGCAGLENGVTLRYWLIGNRESVEGECAFMRVFCAAAMIAMLAGPGYAQSKPKTLEEMMNSKTPDQIEKEQAADRAYKESLKKIPNAKAPADPWGNARSTDAPKAAAKSPTAKKLPAKAGSTAN
jgi:hypothetical protein